MAINKGPLIFLSFNLPFSFSFSSEFVSSSSLSSHIWIVLVEFNQLPIKNSLYN